MKPFHHDLRSRLLGGEEGWKDGDVCEPGCLAVGVAEAIVLLFRKGATEKEGVAEKLSLDAEGTPEASRWISAPQRDEADSGTA